MRRLAQRSHCLVSTPKHTSVISLSGRSQERAAVAVWARVIGVPLCHVDGRQGVEPIGTTFLRLDLVFHMDMGLEKTTAAAPICSKIVAGAAKS